MSERSSGITAWLRLGVGTASRALVVSVIGAVIWMALPTLWGWQATTVMSDSMAPGIRAGDVVVTMPVAPDRVQAGRILLVRDPDHPGRLRLHRYVASEDGAIVTKGDANPQRDSSPVAPSAVVGMAVLRAPWIGLPFVWVNDGRWEAAVLAAGALGVVGMLCGIDSGLRSRRHLLAGRASALGRVLVAAGSGLAVLAVVAIDVLGGGGAAHAAYSRSDTTPSNGLVAAASYPCLSPTPVDAPLVSFAFNEVSGASAIDGSGNGRTGTLQPGATRLAGSCASSGSPAIALDGTTSAAVTTSWAVVAPSSYSIELWLRTTSTTGGRLLGFGDAATGVSLHLDRQLYLTPSGKVALGVVAGLPISITSAASVNDGAWHHVVGSMDGLTGGGTGMRLYVDGALAASSPVALSEATTGYWRVGADSLVGWGFATPAASAFSGAIDDAAVYGTALSASQVAAHAAAGRF
jgi:signal peptidase I